MSLTTFWRWAYSEIQSISVSGTYNTVTEQILFCRRFWKLGHFTHAYVLSTAATANPTGLLIYIYIFITIIPKYARNFLYHYQLRNKNENEVRSFSTSSLSNILFRTITHCFRYDYLHLALSIHTSSPVVKHEPALKPVISRIKWGST